MIHIVSCPRKYNNDEDRHGLLEHNSLKSSYDTHQPTNNSIHNGNDNSGNLFALEINNQEGIDKDFNSMHFTHSSNLDINSQFGYYNNK